MPTTEGVKSNRDKYTSRLKAKYPEKEYPDDESLFEQINEDYDNYDKKLSEYESHEKSLTDLFASNPRSAAFLIDWRNGEDPIIGLIRKFGDDFKAALEDPEKQEALATANKEYAERIAQEEQYEVEYQKNIDATFTMLETLQKEEGLSDEDIDKAMDYLVDVMRNGLLGKFSKESVLMALKAIKYDSDVMQADREGEVRGRNSKIEEKLRKHKDGDKLPTLSGKHGNVGLRKPKTMFDLANEAM